MAAVPLTLARLRRDRLAIWLWLPAGLLAMLLVAQGWRAAWGEPPPRLFTAMDVAWIVVTFCLIWRRSSERCPKCNHRWLRAFPWMSLKHVRCSVCGNELH